MVEELQNLPWRKQVLFKISLKQITSCYICTFHRRYPWFSSIPLCSVLPCSHRERWRKSGAQCQKMVSCLLYPCFLGAPLARTRRPEVPCSRTKAGVPALQPTILVYLAVSGLLVLTSVDAGNRGYFLPVPGVGWGRSGVRGGTFWDTGGKVDSRLFTDMVRNNGATSCCSPLLHPWLKSLQVL